MCQKISWMPVQSVKRIMYTVAITELQNAQKVLQKSSITLKMAHYRFTLVNILHIKIIQTLEYQKCTGYLQYVSKHDDYDDILKSIQNIQCFSAKIVFLDQNLHII